MAELLPVHGFVLAGGQSSRMGEDKALMRFCGRPMVEIAVEKLRGICAEVGIAGNRDDLAGFGEVVHEGRVGIGPAAGLEAALLEARQEWVVVLPVDVPLVPTELLREWVGVVLGRGTGCAVSYLVVGKQRQPAFCMVRRDRLDVVTAAIECGERRLANILRKIGEESGQGGLWECHVEELLTGVGGTTGQVERWFSNVNTPEELIEAEACAQQEGIPR